MTVNLRKSAAYLDHYPEYGATLPDSSGGVLQDAPASNAASPEASEGASTASLPTEHFAWQGREYRLYKRTRDPKAPWYFQFQRGGQRYPTSTKTPVLAVAITKAKALLEASQRQQLASVRAILNPRNTKAAYCSIGQLLDQFDATVLDIGEKHRTGVRSSFRVVLRTATGSEDIEKLSAWILNADTARQYFEAVLVKAKAEKSQEQAARVKRSANSTWTQAVCLLHPRCLAAYKRAELELPDVAPFVGAFKTSKFKKCTTTYNPPGDEVIRKTLHEWLKIKPGIIELGRPTPDFIGPCGMVLTDTEARNMFLAIGLELACGLRIGEVAQTTWGHFTSRHGRALLEGPMTVKNQTGRVSVQPIDPFWRLLVRRIDREKWRGQAHDPLLVGTYTDTTDLIFRQTSAWLRALGWRTEKTNPALRAYSGCLVAMRWDCYRAQQWLRHRSVTTTQGDYGHFLHGAVFTPEKVRVRWSRACYG